MLFTDEPVHRGANLGNSILGHLPAIRGTQPNLGWRSFPTHHLSTGNLGFDDPGHGWLTHVN